jgi:D-lactate dehydrogenase (cytochrome)
VKAIAKAHKSGDFEFAVGAEEQKTLWSARKESLWSMLALRREGDEVWSTDVAVPISRLPDIIGMETLQETLTSADRQQRYRRRRWTT